MNARGVDDRRHAAWDVRNAASNYGALIVAQAIGLCASFGASYLTIRILGKSGFGLVAAVIAASSTISQLGTTWSGMGLVRFGVEEYVRTGHIRRSFLSRTRILIGSLALLAVSAPLWFGPLARYLALPSWTTQWVVLHVLMTVLASHVQLGLQAAKRPSVAANLAAFERMALLVTVLAAGRFGGSTVTILRAYALAPLGPAIVGLWMLRDATARLSTAEAPAPVRMTDMLKFSGPLLPAAVVSYVSSNFLDAPFVVSYVSQEAYGQYAIMMQASTAVLQIPTLLSSLLTPMLVTMATNAAAAAKEYVRSVPATLCWLWSGATIVASVLVPPFVAWVFRYSLAETRAVIVPVFTAFAFAGPTIMVLQPAFAVRKSSHLLTAAATAGAITNVLGDIVLIPRYGLAGSAWASVAAYAATALVGSALEATFPPRQVLLATAPPVVGAVLAGIRWDVGAETAATLWLLLTYLRRHELSRAGRQWASMRVAAIRWRRETGGS